MKIVNIPENLDLKSGLQQLGRNPNHIDRYIYIVQLLNYKMIQDSSYEEGDYIKLKFKSLGNIIGQNNVKKVLTDLINLNVIETDGQYIVGKKCKGYRLTEKYRYSNTKRVPFSNEKLQKRIHKSQMNSLINDPVAGEIIQNMVRTMNQIDISPKSIEYIDSLIGKPHPTKKYKRKKRNKKNRETTNNKCNKGKKIVIFTRATADYYKTIINKIKHKDWFTIFDKSTGRFYHNFTSLPKILRPFLTLNGQPLTEADFKNYQPFLLNIVIKKFIEENYDLVIENAKQRLLNNGMANTFNEKDSDIESILLADIEKYKYLTSHNEKGEDIYIYLNECYIKKYGKDRGRDNIKLSLITNIFFDKLRDNWHIKLRDLFAEEFPNVWFIIRQLKHKNYKNLSKILQSLEADTVIKSLLPKLYKKYPGINILSIHDSLLVEKKYLQAVSKEMVDLIVEKYNLYPQVKIKELVNSEAKNKIYQNSNKLYHNNKSIFNKDIINKSIKNIYSKLQRRKTYLMNIDFVNYKNPTELYLKFENFRL